jgi:hypothetical protein
VDIQSKYVDDGFKLISIHIPALGASTDVNVIAEQASKLNATFPIGIDNGKVIWDAFGNNAFPVAYGIDKQGNIRSKQVGPGIDTIIEVIEKLKAAG